MGNSMKKNSNYIIVQTTTDSINDARKLVNILLADKLIACGQISEIESYYSWKNKVHNSKEYRVIMKTKKGLYSDIENRIKCNHDYDVPSISAYELNEIFEPYGNWIDDNTLVV
tara:strand:+ start:208 stop:549 length:342 start_codon:yes stop_codon:yes gene_type:complete